MQDKNSLYTIAPEINIIAGHGTIIPFQVSRYDNVPVDLGAPKTLIEFTLCQLECNSNVIVSKSNFANGGITVLDTQNEFEVFLSPYDTEGLQGLFTFQIKIVDKQNNTSKPVEGYLMIRQQIG